MQYLMPYLMVAVGLIIMFGFLKLTIKIYSEISVTKIIKSHKIGSPETSAAFVLVFGQNNVITNASMRHLKSSNRVKYKFDNIIIQKNGIFLVTTCPLVGKIDTDDQYVWHQSYRQEGFGQVEADFNSPVEEAKQRITVLYEIADELYLNRKYIKGLVCMSSPSAVLSTYVDDVYNLEDTIQTILNRKVKKNISSFTRRRFKKLIKENVKKSKDTKEMHVTRR